MYGYSNMNDAVINCEKWLIAWSARAFNNKRQNGENPSP
jgi:hypothetical protein